MSDFQKMKPSQVIAYFEHVVSIERASTAEVVEVLKEIDRRQLYLELGYPSLFEYLTKKLHYSNASAQRRIDAARAAQDIPLLKESIECGELKLVQISMVSQAIRQKEKEGGCVTLEEKKELFEELKSLDINESQKVIAQVLDIEVKVQEKTRTQQDDSLRLEITVSQGLKQKLERCRAVLSHKYPHLGWAELIEVLADELLQRKDPRTPRRHYKSADRAGHAKDSSSNSELNSNSQQSAPAAENSKIAVESTSNSKMEVKKSRTAIPRAVHRQVHQKFHSCQFVDPSTGRKCNSSFQLQTEHQHSLWAGGDNSLENLTLLCAAHNRFKYRKESGTRRV